MNPEIFGWQHLVYLAVCLVISIASLVCIKIFVKDEKKQDIIVRCIGGLLLAMIVWNRIAIAISNKNGWNLIPDSFCGMSSLVLALSCILGKRNNAVLHFVVYLALLGDILTVFYPDFIGQNPSFFYPNTISGLLHHTIGLVLCILLFMTGWFKPDWHKWPNLVVGFLAYITLGAFLISVLGYDNAFYINSPILSGTPLTVWVLAPIFAILYVVFMVCYYLISNKLSQKKKSKIEEKEKQA